MRSNGAILRLEALSKTYRVKKNFFGGRGAGSVKALSTVNLEIARGEIFGLVGESGSGKTTAGRLIVKLEEPTAGRILLDGEDITGLEGRALRSYRGRVQMIFQDPYQSLNPQLSIFESIAEPLVIHKYGDSRSRRERVLETIAMVGLSPPAGYANRYPHQLSGGQRQRVAIARAMVMEPDFVVADEPTSMLDASYSAKIFNILLDVRKRYNVTILFITHSLAAARYLCNKIAVIYRGHIVEIGTAEDVIHRPLHPYTQALLDALPRFGQSGLQKPYGTLRENGRAASSDMGCVFFPRCGKAHRIRCSRESPELEAVGPDRKVACFYPDTEKGRAAEGNP